MTSTGLPTDAAAGRKWRIFVFAFSLGTTIFSPMLSAASAAMMPGPPALVITATRLPVGNGCDAKARA
jgi:hypothetical protein